MSIFLAIMAVVLGLFALLVLILAVPIKYSVVADYHEKLDFTLRVSWLFRIVRIIHRYKDGVSKTDLRILFFKIGAKKKKKIVKKETEPISYDILTELQGKTIIKHILVALKEIGKMFLPSYVKISGVVGFECPFKTGMFFGMFEAFAGMFRFRDKISLVADFNTDTDTFTLDAEIRGKLSILKLVLKKSVRDLILKLWRDETKG
ncbi:MAG: hypothetical protein FWF81_03665 [Defluviitaleaceae bacterium]|nr:hypothetical protein [Defluviitaleaceae bacterium]